MANVDVKNDGFHIEGSKDTENVFKEFHKSHLYSDLTLICDEDDTSLNSSAFQVHQILMASKSAYAARAIKNYKEQMAFPYGKVILYLDGISKKILQLIVDFVYVGSVNISEDDIEQFIAAVKRLQIKGLCNNEVIENLKKVPKIQNPSKPPEKYVKAEGKQSENNDMASLAPTIKKEIINSDEEDAFQLIPADNKNIEEKKIEVTSMDTEESKSTIRARQILDTYIASEKYPKTTKASSKEAKKDTLKFTQEMKSKVIEIQDVIEELAQKYFNEEGRNTDERGNACKMCPNKSVRGHVELKRHILTNHLKGKYYQHILDKISSCMKELTNARGFCKLCKQPQSNIHFKYFHVTKHNFAQSVLVNDKEILPKRLEHLAKNGLSVRSLRNAKYQN